MALISLNASSWNRTFSRPLSNPLLFSILVFRNLLPVADVSRNSRKYSELHIPLPPASSSFSFFFFLPSYFSFFFLHQRVTKGTISVTLRESSRERSRSFFRESFQRLEHTVDVCHAEERRTNRVTTNRIFVTITFSPFVAIRVKNDDSLRIVVPRKYRSKPSTEIVEALDRFFDAAGCGDAWGKVGVVSNLFSA